MADFRRMALDLISADGKVDNSEAKLLRKHLYEDGKISHDEVAFLMEVRKRAKRVSPGFNSFYLKAVGDSVLDNRIVSAEEIALLRKVVTDKHLTKPHIRALLSRIKREAFPNPDFDRFCHSVVG